MTAPTIDFSAVKTRQQAAWSTGNYAVVGTTLQIVGESLCEVLDLRSGMTVLDVAAGNGNVSLAAARRWCDVTSTDYVPALLAAGRRRADAEGLPIRFLEADAEALPFDDGAFDAVVSTFGVMFSPDHERAAAELGRTVRVGGKIGMANWTPESFIGQVFKTIGRYLPPAPGMRSPAQWGAIKYLSELFPSARFDVTASAKQFTFRYRSVDHWLEVFRTYYGPINKTYAALATSQQDAFTADLIALMERGNQAHDGTLVLPSEYLEVVIERTA